MPASVSWAGMLPFSARFFRTVILSADFVIWVPFARPSGSWLNQGDYGFLNLSVILSDSPIAVYFFIQTSLSDPVFIFLQCRRVGGRVQTPSGGSRVSFG